MNSSSEISTSLSAQNVQAAAPTPMRRRSHLEIWILMLPAALLQLVWGWYPAVFAFIVSLTDAQPVLPSKFTGLQSYIRMWVGNEPLVALAFRQTIIFALMQIALTFLLPILIAVFLMEMPRKIRNVMMFIWFLPLSAIASTILYRYFYNPDYGMFQYVATNILHLPRQMFLNNTDQAIFWLIFPSILFSGPGLIYMAALQGVPSSYYEASEVEGASFWRKMWTITMPRLRPIISVMMTFGIISSLQEYSFTKIMTDGQPQGMTRFVILYLYELIGVQRYADATALAVYLFILIMGIVILFRTFVKEDPDS